MKLEGKLENGISVQTLRVREGSKSLYLESRVQGEGEVFIRLYNPDNVMVGETVHSWLRFPHRFLVTEGRATKNALLHQLISGDYRLEVCGFGGVEIDWQVVYETESQRIEELMKTKPIHDSEFQLVPWFDKEGLCISYKDIVDPEIRFYGGDFHAHTHFSDGKHSGLEAVELAEREGLDFIAFTEHNRIPFGFHPSLFLALPSFELTLPSGHMNIHGIRQVDGFGQAVLQAKKESDFLRLVPKLHSDAVVTINHPFLDEWAFVESGISLADVDAIEVICDPTYPTSPQANRKSVAFLDYLWSCGALIYGVGGSDSHNRLDDPYEGSDLPSVYGDPRTFVYCQGLSVDHLLEGVRRGNSYVSRFLKLEFDIGDGVLPGDKIELTEGFVYRVQVSDWGFWKGKALVGRMIVNGRMVSEARLTEDSPMMVIEDLAAYLGDVKNWWMRFGIYEENGNVVAYVNPIFGGDRQKLQETFDQKAKEFEENYDQSDFIR